MAAQSVETKPSETAVLAALHRAIAHDEYKNDRFGPDFLAKIFLPPHFRFLIKFGIVRANARNKLHQAFPGMHEFIIARTAYFDGLFRDALKSNIPQIVIFGAGYDSRPYRYSKNNHFTKIYELDSAPTQYRKKQCLKSAHIDIPERVSFVPINFNQESIKPVMEKAGFKGDQETLFLWEGVTYYLQAKAVGDTLGFVCQSSHKGRAIAFDYAIPVSDKNINQYGVKEFHQSMKEYHQEENILFEMEEGKLESYLAQIGLGIANHMDNKAMEREFLVGENGSLLGRVSAQFRLVLASPMGKKPTQRMPDR